MVDYKAIVGDTSDNIPGVKGVGEKTAVALLEKFDTLDAIYANMDKVEKRWQGKFEASKETAYMSRDLARIETNLKLNSTSKMPGSNLLTGRLWKLSLRDEN